MHSVIDYLGNVDCWSCICFPHWGQRHLILEGVVKMYLVWQMIPSKMSLEDAYDWPPWRKPHENCVISHMIPQIGCSRLHTVTQATLDMFLASMLLWICSSFVIFSHKNAFFKACPQCGFQCASLNCFQKKFQIYIVVILRVHFGHFVTPFTMYSIVRLFPSMMNHP